MSHWAFVGPSIKRENFSDLQEACRRNKVRFDLKTLILHDEIGADIAELQSTHTGDYQIRVDTDANYSSLTRRLGRGLGTLMKAYSEIIVENKAVEMGGYISEKIENADGSLVLTVSLGI